MFKKRCFCFWKILQNRKGFTLAELTVTLSILGLMTTIAIPSYLSWLPKHRLLTSARQIYDDLNLAKMRAVQSNTVAYITFITQPTNTYFIFLDDVNPDGIYNAGETILRNNITIENDVNITAANTCGFNNRGMSTTGTPQVRLTNPTGIIMRIDVNTAGNISIVMSKDGGVTWT